MKKNTKKVVRNIIELFFAVTVLFGAVLIFANKQKPHENFAIIATNFPAYDFARTIVGDDANIKMLLKPGGEIHDFDPTPQDILDIENSAIFIYTGGESDEWVKNILHSINTDKIHLIRMMDAVEAVEEEIIDGMDEEKEGNITYDEHVWTSPLNAIKIINAIKTTLVEVFPEKENTFADNAEKYITKLSELDQEFRRVAENSQRKTLIFGDRFPLRYFTDEYKLTYYAAFPGCSEQTEASSKAVSFLTKKIEAEKIPVVLKTELSNGKLADILSAETNTKVLEFHSAHNVSVDDFNNGVTYVDLMKRNLTVLEEALN